MYIRFIYTFIRVYTLLCLSIHMHVEAAPLFGRRCFPGRPLRCEGPADRAGGVADTALGAAPQLKFRYHRGLQSLGKAAFKGQFCHLLRISFLLSF